MYVRTCRGKPRDCRYTFPLAQSLSNNLTCYLNRASDAQAGFFIAPCAPTVSLASRCGSIQRPFVRPVHNVAYSI